MPFEVDPVILDDLDGRPRSDPDWTEPDRLARRPDGLVWCCQTNGWVSLSDAFDHSYSYEPPPDRVSNSPASTPWRPPPPRSVNPFDPAVDPIDSGLAAVRYENVNGGRRPDPAKARRPDGA